MIFTMYKKETADKKHHTNPYRAVNYIRDENGNADLILNGDPETYLKTVTEYKPWDS